MTKIKICGLMTLDDIKAVNEAKPDLAGFIFAPGRHQINLEQALKMRKELDSSIKSVGVFVNASLDEMLKVINSGAVSMIQLHGNETPDTIKLLQDKNIPVIKVYKPDNLPTSTTADYLMIDSGSGNGKPIQWDKLRIKTDKPLIIAGALDTLNIEQAIKTTEPDFVDLSRGVETDGSKDPIKINKIVQLVHQL
ncbi:phosphoribosylanthranilate isomerase [Companilactobacillus mishanensis]|uniref:N-(5'-phosphoribosyl)anthranilate isomerase n=1 Tax=Companilactobacillus mishanensis TaxID=2486008 RepID=A0ABW9P8X2_9LACO|nr:phosphoribosylanthranilate isomerase [Companilactobacillus mishanensis]MQS45497.1 phosphoribosylanthranilate isomerase [Companilactobacillus mishanensis]